MILDTMDRLNKYQAIPYISEITKFIDTNRLQELQEGDITIIEDELFVKVLKYTPRKASEGYFETHKEFADLQFVIKGVESMYYVNSKHITPTDKFEMSGDFEFFEASECITNLVISEGEFAIFLPGEPHKPGCIVLNESESESEVMKLVFKIKIH